VSTAAVINLSDLPEGVASQPRGEAAAKLHRRRRASLAGGTVSPDGASSNETRSALAVLEPPAGPSAQDFAVYLQVIHRETENYLARLGRAASEGRAVDEANNFLRWLQFSGVLKVLEMHAFLDRKFLTLRARADAVQEICRPHLQGRNPAVNPQLARVDELNNKVDVLLALMAKSSGAAAPEILTVTDVGGVKS
jgi:hypothetical protein